MRPYLYKHTIESSVFTSYTRTDCWRGYVGHWAIEDDKLYLIELDRFEEFSIQELDRFEDVPIRNILNDLFPGQQKVFAEWYSGSIHTTLDDMYMYFDFKIEKGRLVEVEKKESKYKGMYMRNFDEL